VSADDLRDLAARVLRIDLGPVREAYAEAVHKVRDLGIAFSDRRAVKVQKLLAASAVLCGRAAAAPSDLWVLRYVWDRAEQIGPLRGLVHALLEQHQSDEAAHPLATLPEVADGEEIARQLDAVARELDRDGGKAPLPLVALARLRERVAELADRAAWVQDERAREHLVRRGGELLGRLG
jgi:MoxR-like ATPase